tara:strand:- start:136 stop:594 length:459 start_codon:yes stop_codon:yes gene_type:complete
MADKKISQLNAATALQGSELIPVVQSSETKYSTIKDIVNYLVPTTLTVSVAGGTVDLGSSTYDDAELIVLSWSGATGTVELTLPDATSTNSTNRVIRIISDSTFSTSTHADLTPDSGQNLDGSSSAYRINKEYEGITVWSNGTEWFIIQAKA